MSRDIKRPSHGEYVDAIHAGFGFLETLGFLEQWDERDQFKVAFTRGEMVVRAWGWGWGESGHASVELDGEELPFLLSVTSRNQLFTAPTGKPQLDDLNELAYRLKHEFIDVLNGDLTQLIPYRPIPHAEQLWRKHSYVELIEGLVKCEHPLSKIWQARYEHASKNV